MEPYTKSALVQTGNRLLPQGGALSLCRKRVLKLREDALIERSDPPSNVRERVADRLKRDGG